MCSGQRVDNMCVCVCVPGSRAPVDHLRELSVQVGLGGFSDSGDVGAAKAPLWSLSRGPTRRLRCTEPVRRPTGSRRSSVGRPPTGAEELLRLLNESLLQRKEAVLVFRDSASEAQAPCGAASRLERGRRFVAAFHGQHTMQTSCACLG